MLKSAIAAAVAGIVLFTAAPAAAEVVERHADGFTLNYERRVNASHQAVFGAVGRPSDWWSDAHTYSGNAGHIRLDLRPGGCWCEDLPSGGVKHGEVVLVWPERRMVRFDAPFGPLQSIGADAVLTMSWAELEGQSDRSLKWTFVVSGPGAGAMADTIDGVMSEQFGRLAEHLEGD